MIVQTLAIEHPERATTLTSIMSTTGEPAYYQSVPEVRAMLLQPVPDGRDATIAATVERNRAMSSPRYFNADDAAAREGRRTTARTSRRACCGKRRPFARRAAR